MKNFFKKRSVLITAGILCISIFLAGCSDKKEQGQENLTPVTLSEVAHSIFYAPQYAAYEPVSYTHLDVYKRQFLYPLR